MEPKDKKQCAMCPRPGKACLRCTNIHYCSKEVSQVIQILHSSLTTLLQCRKEDWPVHRTLCASFSKFKDRPHSQVRRAIYFPVDGSKPEFVWLPMENDHPVFDAINKTYFGSTDMWPVSMDDNPLLNRTSDRDILLQSGKYFAADGSKVNQCIYKLTGENNSFWRGQAVTDLRTILDTIMVRYRGVEEIKGVCINCNFDMRVPNRPGFVTISVPQARDLTLGLIGSDSTIARRFGMPLTVIALPREVTIKDHEERLQEARKQGGEEEISTDFGNSMAGYLMLSCSLITDESLQKYGDIPKYWRSSSLGDIIVVCKDGKPLSPKYLEAFCLWVRDEIQPRLKQVKEEMVRGGDKNAQEDKIWDEITKTKFNDWCLRSRSSAL